MYSWQVGKRSAPRPGSAVVRISLLWSRGLRRGLLSGRGQVFPSVPRAKGEARCATELAQWVPLPRCLTRESGSPSCRDTQCHPGRAKTARAGFLLCSRGRGGGGWVVAEYSPAANYEGRRLKSVQNHVGAMGSRVDMPFFVVKYLPSRSVSKRCR